MISTVLVATVTYGDRAETCLTVTRAALDAGADACLIVDNGSTSRSAALLDDAVRSDSRLRLVRLPENGGSAVGFRAAISSAVDLADSGWIWLLDDDNLPRSDALRRALATAEQAGGRVAVACLRTSDPLQRAVVYGARVDRTLAFPGSFLGFDLASRLRRASVTEGSARHVTEVPWAPYGGLLVRAADARRVDPPYESFVLYGDDRDWCGRLRSSGVRILLDPDAVVDDLIDRWSTAGSDPVGGVLERTIRSEDHRRAYYLVRNTAFQDRRAITSPFTALRFVPNVLVYTAAVVGTSIRVGRPAYIRVFLRALVSGFAGRWYAAGGA